MNREMKSLFMQNVEEKVSKRWIFINLLFFSQNIYQSQKMFYKKEILFIRSTVLELKSIVSMLIVYFKERCPKKNLFRRKVIGMTRKDASKKVQTKVFVYQQM